MINAKHILKLDLSKKWNVIVDQVVAQQRPGINWTRKSNWCKTLDQAAMYTLDQKWRAVKAIVKMEQQKHCGEEMSKSFKHGGWCETELRSVAASFVIRGLLRAQARVDLSAEFHVQGTRPILGPRTAEMTRRIVQWTYVRLGPWTSAVGLTTILQRRIWIWSRYEYVRGILRHCFEYQCLPNKSGRQKMGEFPREIVTYERLEPFRHVSLDFIGPFKVRVKTILCEHCLVVIVCRQLSAVHLESAGRLDTGDLILALLRFGVRRGCSTTIPSDRGGLFESGRAEVLDSDQKALGVDWSLVESKVGVSRWEFSPSYEPEFNGLAGAYNKTTEQLLGWTKTLKRLENSLQRKWVLPLEVVENYWRTVKQMKWRDKFSKKLFNQQHWLRS
jgi:hypothetical protein